ncbi:ribosome maturation factor RimM [Tessaracoccus lacteus]|uniref:Ribosome maturation factor RimM n=1 Tax=Tessaracoccus lacteus TaxID=3041766 RepID=A0ABY8PV36_9ACTN|nr:ribosome maturation factor RimM [Tessaracoccus sp. T21]WGT46303.1 ribosome maturation factor RimM [Tessaracoccus sp. T21]
MSEQVEVTVGRFGRAVGIRGEIAVELRTDEPARRFRPGVSLRLGDTGRSVEIDQVRWNRGRLAVTLVGYPDRTAVEALTGLLLHALVPSDERPSEPEEYFDRQLVGLKVLDHRGAQVGTVTEVLHMPAQEVLQVDVTGEERLVPFVSALVPVVDLASGHVQLADVPGLLEDVE